jgi:hypothetical protein
MSLGGAERTAQEIGPDGMRRPQEAERRLNAIALAVFSSPEGQELLAYLRSITLNRVSGPEVSTDALRHHEGMRFLFQVIAARIERGTRQ